MRAEIPKYDAFLRPGIVALDAMGGSGSIGEIEDRVAADLKLVPEIDVEEAFFAGI